MIVGVADTPLSIFFNFFWVSLNYNVLKLMISEFRL